MHLLILDAGAQHGCIEFNKQQEAVQDVSGCVRMLRTSCASGLRVIAMTSPIFNLLRRMYGAAAVHNLSEEACQRQLHV